MVSQGKGSVLTGESGWWVQCFKQQRLEFGRRDHEIEPYALHPEVYKPRTTLQPRTKEL